uniref:Uncharacterized protein n=1 Tax=Rhizophora mucronata TaxID=61149 RepID=A0A2P2N2Z2_RHIMU
MYHLVGMPDVNSLSLSASCLCLGYIFRVG